MADGSPLTWRRYAYALVVWLEFLEVSGREWHRATPRDVEAFKHWRVTEPGNGDRVAPTSFDTDRAALNSFYGWASAELRRAESGADGPPARSGQRGTGSDAGLERARGVRDPIPPCGSTRHQVKWMLRPALEQWRDIGLRGYGFDGLRRGVAGRVRGPGCGASSMACMARACGCGSGQASWMSSFRAGGDRPVPEGLAVGGVHQGRWRGPPVLPGSALVLARSPPLPGPGGGVTGGGRRPGPAGGPL